jgi:hypothetical protein
MKKGLKISFKSLNRNRVLPTRVGGTRCLPHLARAFQSLKRDIKPSETTMKLPHMKTPRLRA